MEQTLVYARVFFADGLAVWPVRVWVPEGSGFDPMLVARIHVRSLAGALATSGG